MEDGENDVDSNTDEPRRLTQQEALEELASLIVQAKKGDPQVVPRLKEYLRQVPALWQRDGDLALQSQVAWIKRIAGNDKFLQECLESKVNDMKASLTNDETPLLEYLLVERITSTWLQLYYHECQQAQQDENSLRWATFRMKQANAASDRHLKAVAALATMKKLIKDSSEPKSEPVATLPHEAPSGGVKDAGDTAASPHSDNRLSFHLKATQNSYHDVLDG